MDDIDLGHVFLAKVIDKNGRSIKPHFVMILTERTERPIKAVVFSTKVGLASRTAMVRIDHALNRPGGHPVTGLTRRCAAICDWLNELDETDLLEHRGRIFGSLLEKIVTCVRENQNPSTPS